MPTFGRPVHHGVAPSITARYFSANLSDSTSRWTPCPPVVFATDHELRCIPLACLHRFQLRARLGFSLSMLPGRRGVTPVFGYGVLHPNARGTLILLIWALPSTHYGPLRHPDTARPVTSRSAGWSAHASTAGASRVASVLRLRACPHHYPGRIDRDGSLAPLGGFPSRHRPSLDTRRVGSCIDCFGACSVFTRVRACLLAGSPKAIRYIRGFSRFVTSTTAPIATGWSDPVPGRDLHPLKNNAFPRRTSGSV